MQQNELTMMGFLLILLLISNINCFYISMCTHACVHTYISKHKKMESMKPQFFLALMRKKISWSEKLLIWNKNQVAALGDTLY